MARKAKYATKKIDPTTAAVAWKWTDQTTDIIPVSDLDANIQNLLTLYGLSQKLGDAYSAAESLAEAKAMFGKVLDGLRRGDWSVRGQGFGAVSIEECIARAMGITLEEATERWTQMPEDRRKAIQAHPSIKAAQKAIELERAQARAESTEADLSDLFTDD